MTQRECYDQIHGNYDEILKRLGKPEKIDKYLALFPKDQNFPELVKAMEEKRYEDAFRAVHTLKGVTASLSFTQLNALASEVTEALREGKDIALAIAKMDELSEKYNQTVEVISRYL